MDAALERRRCATNDTMTTIIGVDFSGHREDRNTWTALGNLTDDGALLLDWVQPVRRDDLYHLLANVPTPAVAALDFPFGVPRAFAEFLSRECQPQDMTDVWRVVSQLTATEFVAQRYAFVGQRAGSPLFEREPKRAGDLAYHRESYSPLHTVNPNMLPMTYEGIRLLHRWHQEMARRWHVPPLEPTGSPSKRVTLLELMPGAFLKSVGLPFKGYKKGRNALEKRDEILGGLADASGIGLPNLDRARMACRANDDCLDAVVAAVGAAAWASDGSRFHHPDEDELADAELEGWIYVPGSDGSGKSD